MVSTSLYRQTLHVIGLAGLFLFAGTSRASACSCAVPLDAELAASSADIVFEGRATEVEALQTDLGLGGYAGARRFRFEVTRYFKGQLGPDLSVFTVDQDSACGREYPFGEPHLVYARYTESGILSDSLCSRSHPVALAERDLVVLGSGVAPDPSVLDEASSGEATPQGSDIQRIPVAAGGGPSGCAASLASERSTAAQPAFGMGCMLAGLIAWRASARRRRRA
jgi:hypothetical protein